MPKSCSFHKNGFYQQFNLTNSYYADRSCFHHVCETVYVAAVVAIGSHTLTSHSFMCWLDGVVVSRLCMRDVFFFSFFPPFIRMPHMCVIVLTECWTGLASSGIKYIFRTSVIGVYMATEHQYHVITCEYSCLWMNLVIFFEYISELNSLEFRNTRHCQGNVSNPYSAC